MKLFRKLAAVLMAAVICISATSCGDTSWAMSVDGEKIPAGVYLLNQLSALQEAERHEDFDKTAKDLWAMKLDDKKLADWVNDRAAELTREYAQIEKMFAEADLTLTDEQLEAIDYSVAQNWAPNAAAYQKLGIAQSSYEMVLLNTLKYREVFNAYYAEGGSAEVPKEELLEQFETEYASVRIFRFIMDSKAEDAEAEKKAKSDEANAYLERLQNGEDIEELLTEYAQKIADENLEEGEESEPVEIDTTPFIMKKDEINYYNYIPSVINTAIFESAKIGEPIVFNDDSGYYLVERYDVKDDPEDFEDMKATLLYDLRNGDFDKIISDGASSLNVEYNNNALKQFKPKKLLAE